MDKPCKYDGGDGCFLLTALIIIGFLVWTIADRTREIDLKLDQLEKLVYELKTKSK